MEVDVVCAMTLRNKLRRSGYPMVNTFVRVWGGEEETVTRQSAVGRWSNEQKLRGNYGIDAIACPGSLLCSG